MMFQLMNGRPIEMPINAKRNAKAGYIPARDSFGLISLSAGSSYHVSLLNQYCGIINSNRETPEIINGIWNWSFSIATLFLSQREKETGRPSTNGTRTFGEFGCAPTSKTFVHEPRRLRRRRVAGGDNAYRTGFTTAGRQRGFRPSDGIRLQMRGLLAVAARVWDGFYFDSRLRGDGNRGGDKSPRSDTKPCGLASLHIPKNFCNAFVISYSLSRNSSPNSRTFP